MVTRQFAGTWDDCLRENFESATSLVTCVAPTWSSTPDFSCSPHFFLLSLSRSHTMLLLSFHVACLLGKICFQPGAKHRQRSFSTLLFFSGSSALEEVRSVVFYFFRWTRIYFFYLFFLLSRYLAAALCVVREVFSRRKKQVSFCLHKSFSPIKVDHHLERDRRNFHSETQKVYWIMKIYEILKRD